MNKSVLIIMNIVTDTKYKLHKMTINNKYITINTQIRFYYHLNQKVILLYESCVQHYTSIHTARKHTNTRTHTRHTFYILHFSFLIFLITYSSLKSSCFIFHLETCFLHFCILCPTFNIPMSSVAYVMVIPFASF